LMLLLINWVVRSASYLHLNPLNMGQTVLAVESCFLAVLPSMLPQIEDQGVYYLHPLR